MKRAVSAAEDKRIFPIIVCGGSGTRLWPASRSSHPKQFLALFGELSTFQMTALRVSRGDLFGRMTVVTNSRHRFLVADQLEQIGMSADILLEPEAKDSGPAILAGALLAAELHGPRAVALSLAADHLIRDVEGFHDACGRALAASNAGRIVMFGVTPDHAADGYGYVKPGEALDPAGAGVTVERFVEKPDTETAARFVREGYLWNSGNFLFEARTLVQEYARRQPATVEAVRQALADRTTDIGFLRLEPTSFGRAAKGSIDRTVMEGAPTAVVPAGFDWSDVGSWGSVRSRSQQDEAGNAALGSARFVNARGNVVSSDGPLVALAGVDDLTVVVTGDAVLVARRDDAASVRAVVESLRETDPVLTEERLESFRPWGSYRSLDRGTRHQVKRIVIKPGGRLSLQKHFHRAEHWIVVRGTAFVKVGAKVTTLHENQSIYVPMGAVHRMENPGKIDLEIIEVQTGGYFGEDDIVRLEDVYDRGVSGTV